MHGLVTRGGHCLPSDAVDLVEGMRPEQPVVSCADEQLQRQRLTLHVTMKLRGENRHVLKRIIQNINASAFVQHFSKNKKKAQLTSCIITLSLISLMSRVHLLPLVHVKLAEK